MRERPAIPRMPIAALLLAALAEIAFFIAVVYVALHFIQKFW